MKAIEDLKTVPLFSTFIRYLRVSKLNIGHSSTHVTCSNCFSVYNTDLRSFMPPDLINAFGGLESSLLSFILKLLILFLVYLC